MKQFFIVLLLFVFKFSIGQEFETQLYFEDSQGNKDTIIVGFDVSASDSVDQDFAEQNIIDTPLDSSLDVRIVKTVTENYFFDTINFHLKKQILHKVDDCHVLPFEINIVSKNFPVTMTWDSSAFTYCNADAIITDVEPGGWFDVAGDYHIDLKTGNKQVIESDNLSISLFVLLTTSDDPNSISNFYESALEIYPNPATDYCIINLDAYHGTIEVVKVFDINGRLNYSNYSVENNLINLNRNILKPGQYYLHLTTSKGSVKTSKIILK